MNQPQNILQEHDWEMVVRYLDGLCSPGERERIDERIREDKLFAREFDRARVVWSASRYRPASNAVLSFDVHKDWKRINEAIGSEADGSRKSRLAKLGASRYVQRRYVQIIRLAAILLITILSSVFITYMALSPVESTVPEIVFREIQTDRNQRVNLLLSDGTGVSMSVESRLRIPEKFAADIREVELVGEARFDVAHAPTRPFIIRSGDITVEVLGTDFGVRAYENEGRVDVVVKSGSVAVASSVAKTPERVILAPGQLVSVYRSGESMRTRWVNPEDYLSWMSGRMKFYETPFTEVIRQLERWYDIEIQITHNAITDFSLTALLDMRSMQNVFEVISQSLKLKYDISEQVVVLSLQEEQ
jgi:transmembrane sensor